MTGRLQLDFTVSRQLTTLVPAADVFGLLEETGRIGDEFGPGSSVQLCGTVSLMLDGQEQLGPRYWIELYNMVHLAPLAGGETLPISETVATGQGESGRAQFQRRSDGAVDYSLMIKEKVLLNRSIPLQPLVDAWTYLWFRIHRLEAEMGDTSAISATKSYDRYFPKGYFDQVDQSVIAFALEAPLEEVLSSPKSFG